WGSHGTSSPERSPETPQASTPSAIEAWVPAAGVPWFVSLFGRDALVVSLQTLALSPRFALGALRALGSLQAEWYDDERDMQPGKIEHEVRHGELATLHLIPHTPYYGSHDATTLYVWAAAEAWRWHGDRAELDAVRPHVERALAWIDTDGDIDGDGLQEYQTRAGTGGYYNQGWKDSGEAIVHSDGRLAPLPIALCELQGYVVAAKRAWAAVLYDVYHEAPSAARLRGEADRLAEQIEERFWWEEEQTYYLGLDGHKEPIATVASNPGHLLWAGAVVPERARLVAQRLLAADMWSGWGIRTLSECHPSYNPFSYQLGSVWPHDNAIAVAGFRRYGLDAEAGLVARAIFDAGERFLSRRLPELFAGLTRDAGSLPAQYLGANVPQAWAAGAVVHLLTSLLGMSADAPARVLSVDPALPDWLNELSVANLCVGDAAVDLVVRREPDGGHSIEVVRRHGRLEVRLEPGRLTDAR
ncbi:MAG: amylo-alpha-1,6-glucosidase, partial [Acidimicrobiales bacterium]